VRIWNFATQHLEGEMDTGSAVTLMSLHRAGSLVGRCRLTASKPLLKAPMGSALDATI